MATINQEARSGQTILPRETIDVLRQTPMHTILEVLGYDVRHTPSGNYHSPFREDKDPSFHIDERQHLFFDHGGDNDSGDTIGLVRKLLNVSFEDACKFLLEMNPSVSSELTPRKGDSQKPVSGALTGYVNHSGGAIGADTEWGSVGHTYGVVSKHYYHGNKTPNGNTPVSEEDFAEGKEAVYRANKTLWRRPEKVMDLLARNWMQVKNAEAVFAVGVIDRSRLLELADRQRTYYQVSGGTGWAVQMAIDSGKPVYVFDQDFRQWYTYNPTEETQGGWARLGAAPVLTQNFAGIGTRQLNDAGRAAIADTYKTTIRHLIVNETGKARDEDFMKALDRGKKVNVWAGSSENTELSNMAIRPFSLRGVLYHSVEQWFQYNKALFARDEKTAKEILECESPYEAKLLGRQVRNLDTKGWAAISESVMEMGVRLSFTANPDAADKLLQTGNALITHEQEKGIWKETFPYILMKVRASMQRQLLDDHGEYRGTSVIELKEIKEGITSPSLLKYETLERAIHPDILNRYCHQVSYSVTTQTPEGEKKMTHLAIGFPNHAGQWALRGLPYKDRSGKMNSGIKRSTGNDATYISCEGTYITDAEPKPSHRNVVVFEGFNNFLSWLSWKEQIVPKDSDVVVLNSVNNLERALPFILSHSTVYTYLDVDKNGTGQKATETISKAAAGKGVELKDCSYIYGNKGLNDLNDMWKARSAELRKAGHVSKLDRPAQTQGQSVQQSVHQEGETTHKKGGFTRSH